MMAVLSAKLREFAAHIEGLTLKSAPARLAAALERLSAEAGDRTFRLKQTKRQLAAQLGTRPETLSRALADLKRRGIVQVAGPRITILDAERLGEVAVE